MARTVILGAGFGGIAAAVELRSQLDDAHEVVLIDRGETFMMGLRKLWALTGVAPLAEGQRPLSALARLGIDFRRAEVESLSPAHRSLRTAQGELEADYLVVALGAETRPDLVPGLAENGHNVWRAQDVPAATEALERLERGRVLILVAGAPYPCPPAPYECAMLLDEYLRQRGRRQQVEISVATIQPLLMPNAGRDGSAWLGEQLAQRGIAHAVGKRLRGVDPGRVVFEDGSEPFDLLIGVPPHRPPAVVREAGLTGDADWIAIDPRTLQTRFEGVYAVGDATQVRLANGLPLPKAGVIAELEGSVVAGEIASRILGASEPGGFEGRGYCFMEMGRSQAALIEGDFYAQPEPRVGFTAVSADNAVAKRRFEAERLERWFGA